MCSCLCLFPSFIGALALTAMVNGLWMTCNGFMVSLNQLNVFYKYVFYYISYQSYTYQALLSNEFASRTYQCDANCHCMYESALLSQCLIDGKSAMAEYGFKVGNQGVWIGIMISIIAGMRLMGWGVMEWRK